MIAGLERFLVEFIRRNDDVALGLTAAQLESLALFVVGAVWLAVVGRRGGLLRDDAPARQSAPRCRRPELREPRERRGASAGRRGVGRRRGRRDRACGAASAGGAGAGSGCGAASAGGAGEGSGCGAASAGGAGEGSGCGAASAGGAGAGSGVGVVAGGVCVGPGSAGCGVASAGGVGLSCVGGVSPGGLGSAGAGAAGVGSAVGGVGVESTGGPAGTSPSTGLAGASLDSGAVSVGGASSARVASASALRPVGPGRAGGGGRDGDVAGATATSGVEEAAVVGVGAGSVGFEGSEPVAWMIGVAAGRLGRRAGSRRTCRWCADVPGVAGERAGADGWAAGRRWSAGRGGRSPGLRRSSSAALRTRDARRAARRAAAEPAGSPGSASPCALGQASRKGRMSLRNSARHVPISAKAMIAPESHARVARVRPGPSRIILDGTSTRKADHSSPRKEPISRRKADLPC